MSIETLKQYEDIQMAQQYLIIIDTMKKGGWRADQPLIEVKPAPGVDTLCGKDFLDEMNVDLNKFMIKLNRKMLKRIKVVEKESLVTLGDLDGLKEKLFERHPSLDPNYVEPGVEEGPKEKK